MVRVDLAFDAPGDRERTTGVLAIAKGRAGSLEGLRVLDLACRTGAFSRAFAKAGAEVLGIEGKEFNFNQIPATPGAKFLHQDVRELSVEQHGMFDITLCLGILYHLDAADAVKLLTAMRSVTKKFAIIDTHIGGPTDEAIVNGENYQGSWYSEGVPGPWSSIGNDHSFWFTPASLHTACTVAGWSVVEAHDGVRSPAEPANRYWLIVS